MRTNLKLLLAGSLLCFTSLKGYSTLPLSVEKVHIIAGNADYLGDYTYTQGGQTMTMSVSEDKGNLILKISTEQTVYNLSAVKDKKDEFEVTESGKAVAALRFTRNDGGKVDAFMFTQGGQTYKWQKKQ